MTFGLDHQLNDVSSLQLHYVHKQVDRAIEDTGALDANSNEIYIIANPGEGLTELAFTGPNGCPSRSATTTALSSLSRSACATTGTCAPATSGAACTATTPASSQSDENGRTSPNVGRLWDYPLMMFQDGGTAALGPLATDRPHQFKAQFIYQFDFGTSFGVNEYIASGLPVVA